MNTEIKARWQEALRSGKYQQGTGRLRSDDGLSFCCLGVLCDLYSPELWEKRPKPNGGEYYNYKASVSDRMITALPSHVCLWSGLKDNDPIINGLHLSEMNDEGRSFAEIAEALEVL